MKAKLFKRISFIWIFALIFVVSASETPEGKSTHVIQGVPHHPMLDGFCAMTSLWMNLEYYSQDVDIATLLNLGWGYGFFYWKTPSKTWIYPNTGPVEEIVYAASLMGFQAKVIMHQSIDEAKQTLVDHLSRNIPVIVQWIGHTILAFGYENGGETIIYHNPDDPNLKINDESEVAFDDPFAFNRANIRQWEGPPWLWGIFGYKCIVLVPINSKPTILWKDVFKRNAMKTRGILKDSYPAEYGLDGLHKLIQDIEKSQIMDNQELVRYLYNFEGFFYLGTGFRREVSAFLAGRASATQNRELFKASQAFRESAHYFRRGYNLFVKLKPDHSLAASIKEGYVRILKKIAECEQRGADSLRSAADFQ